LVMLCQFQSRICRFAQDEWMTYKLRILISCEQMPVFSVTVKYFFNVFFQLQIFETFNTQSQTKEVCVRKMAYFKFLGKQLKFLSSTSKTINSMVRGNFNPGPSRLVLTLNPSQSLEG